ncbi:MAG: DUF4430 domain-containing protein [Clostridiales Family XIII bacterium]|jgi:hypothetical protein|nr:DUF4430 domain-containing protein [Clostridiales Family XIII bacterium]
MKKHRTKSIGAAVILCLLALAWFFGGDYANRSATHPASTASAQDAEASPGASETAAPSARADAAESTRGEAATSAADAGPALSDADAPLASPTADMPAAPPLATPAKPSVEAGSDPAPVPVETPAPQADPEAGRDPYRTDPTPEGKPLPSEPQDAEIGETAYTVTLSVRCDTILNNTERLDPAKHELVPADGVIFPATAVTFYEGESVFNILLREMKRAKIHLEFVNTPIYNSAYIEGISNLYEFDVGELSGWEYKVNDWFPNYGCSRYQLKDGDVIEWIYTCDLGRDIGGYNRLGAS